MRRFVLLMIVAVAGISIACGDAELRDQLTATSGAGTVVVAAPSATPTIEIAVTQYVEPDDPTAIPTQTQQPHVPPSPDPLFTPSPYVSPTEPAFQVLVPAADEIKIDASGKYYADGPKGCPWYETRRILAPPNYDHEEIQFSTPCENDIFLTFDPVTREVSAWAP